MSRKSILNATSRKKRNAMMTYSNTNATDGSTRAVGPLPLTVNGINGGRVLWCATAQDLTYGTDLAKVGQDASRTSQTCYMRGLSEHIRLQTSSSISWLHRRICFTYKGPLFTQSSTADSPTQPVFTYLENSQGIQRLAFNANINNMTNTINNNDGIIFKGASGVDWNDPILAVVDTRRVTVKFDKTWTIRSGNERGIMTERKLWHPMNQNIVYDDDETGGTEQTSFLSVDSKAGMGDYYVYDIITAGSAATSSDLLVMNFSSNLYWHEK